MVFWLIPRSFLVWIMIGCVGPVNHWTSSGVQNRKLRGSPRDMRCMSGNQGVERRQNRPKKVDRNATGLRGHQRSYSCRQQ